RRVAAVRGGGRLGKEDHVVTWSKPARPDWMEPATYDDLPATMEVRVVRVHVDRRGFRTRVLDLVTTLLDADVYTKKDLASLYRRRWDAEGCPAGDIPRCGLYPPTRSSHSERGGAAAPGPLVPGAPSRHRRAAAMRTENERPVPPRPQAA